MVAQVSRHPIAIVAAVLASSLLLAGIAFWMVSALFLYRPVDPVPYRFDAVVVNDTPGPVVLRECDPQGCGVFYRPSTLLSGARTTVITSSDDSPHLWVVSDDSGQTLGCLNLQFTRQIPDLEVSLSAVGECTANTPHFIPPPRR